MLEVELTGQRIDIWPSEVAKMSWRPKKTLRRRRLEIPAR